MDGLSKIPPSLSCNELPAPNELNKLILHELKTPFIFKNILQGRWIGPLNWNPQAISHILSNVTTKFKVCPKYTSKEYKDLLSITDVVYETHCQYIEATFGEFNEWLLLSDDDETDSRPKRRAGGLSQVCRDTHWVYADYKYMKELCKNYPDVIRAIDWGVFGFESRNGNESTLWVGTEGACTPCHYDTYGCNLVAQLWGTKEWTLYPPTDDLYPTRIPYEESSVFSSVNLKSPQVEKYPNFSKATPYKVTLLPGDVLFVPYHWWHYVECIDPAVSVNTWIELPQDDEDRLKEAIVRTLVSCAISEENDPSLVNPNEVIFPLKDNLALLSMVAGKDKSLTTSDFINIITSNGVLNAIVNEVNSLC